MEVPRHTTIDTIVKSRLAGGNRMPKGRRSAPKAETRLTGKPDPFAYTLKDPNVGTMQVLNSSNAWWLDATKVQKLIDAYKFWATDKQACYYAGITVAQLEYFEKLHPDFYGIKEACKQDANLRARKRIVGDIDKDTGNAWKWLERTEKEAFGANLDITTGGERLPANVNNEIVFVSFGADGKRQDTPDTPPLETLTDGHASSE